MTLSNSVNDEFRNQLNNKPAMGGFNGNELSDLTVRVLTTGYWPGQNSPPIINLPR